ncbi:hypothetical protein ADU37_CDS17320 [Thermococcus sp. 2319x1]|uniref:hypothetical protein n=1 Tax=Thermococcus sp. 2319x1 TaxID=1674923 RepID=UPI00073AC56B|nr:hypothetical protein [Thermococcus sp. 2319x1]ALV63431.1 hypothetical protein ADU37_CDS17320 [Thermococcus sp. 2319x1]
MDWKSLIIGFIIGALIAVPYGLAHSGGIDEDRGSFWNGWGMMSGHGMGMMGYGMHGMMDKHEDFTEMHEEMEKEMEEHMGVDWEEMKEMHETCEGYMGFEEEEEDH